MDQVYAYYSKVRGLRGRFGGLPSWARSVVLVAAVPGILLIALSILALLVSILALLLLTVPVYSLMKTLTGGGEAGTGGVPVQQPDDAFGAPGRKRVDATVID